MKKLLPATVNTYRCLQRQSVHFAIYVTITKLSAVQGNGCTLSLKLSLITKSKQKPKSVHFSLSLRTFSATKSRLTLSINSLFTRGASCYSELGSDVRDKFPEIPRITRIHQAKTHRHASCIEVPDCNKSQHASKQELCAFTRPTIIATTTMTMMMVTTKMIVLFLCHQYLNLC